MDANHDVAARVDRRLDALGFIPAQVDAGVGLPPGATARLRDGTGLVPGGRFLRRLCAVLDTDEEYLLGLEPGDLVAAELLAEPQGDLGLLAPDEEALLRHYRSLSVPVRAALGLVVAQAAGAAADQAEGRALEAPVKPAARRGPRGKSDAPSLFG